MEAPASTASIGWLLACRRCTCRPRRGQVGSVLGEGGRKAVSSSGEHWQPAASGGRRGVTITHRTDRASCEARWGGRRGLGGAACGRAGALVALLPASVTRTCCAAGRSYSGAVPAPRSRLELQMWRCAAAVPGVPTGFGLRICASKPDVLGQPLAPALQPCGYQKYLILLLSVHGQSFGHEPRGRCHHPCTPTGSAKQPCQPAASRPCQGRVIPSSVPHQDAARACRAACVD